MSIVQIPRFYVDIPQFLIANKISNPVIFSDAEYSNLISEEEGWSLIGLTPSRQVSFANPDPGNKWFILKFPYSGAICYHNEEGNAQNYVAFLGHNFQSANIYQFYGQWYNSSADRVSWNSNNNGTNFTDGVLYNGFSIKTSTDPGYNYNQSRAIFTNSGGDGDVSGVKLSTVSIGSYFDMVNAPNLELKLIREFGKTNESTSITGNTICNQMWDSPPKWGESAGPWQLWNDDDNLNHNLYHSSKRSWKLKFSHIDNGSLWGSNQSLNHLVNSYTGFDGNDYSLDGALNLESVLGGNIMESDDPNSYSSFSASSTGFTGTHTQGASSIAYTNTPTSTNGDISVASGKAYKVSFNLFLSGEPPKYEIASQSQGVSITSEGSILAVEGYNETIFNVNATDSSALIRFFHSSSFADSTITVSNLKCIEMLTEQSVFKYNLLTDNNWFSQVWVKTIAGSLPFIFSPDKDSTSADNYCIARIKNQSLKAVQNSYNTWDISMIIEESW